MEEYGFRDVGEHCGACHRSFQEDENLYSALRRQEDRYERLDFCESCWEGSKGNDLFCYWKRKPRTKETQATVDGSVVFDIFQRLEGSADRHDQNFRYILALLLMRRKRLKFVDIERTDEGEFLVLHDRQLEDVKYRLLDPGMSEEEMQHAKEEVGALFSVNVDEKSSPGAEKSAEEGRESPAEEEEGGEKEPARAGSGEEQEGEGDTGGGESDDGQSVPEVH